ncbi:MAG: L-arabinonate dehydratase [Pseudomonadota bacterium]
MTKAYEELRSARWLAQDDTQRSWNHRSRIMQMGYGAEDWTGKPVIALVNTWSDINQCHAHFRERVADVKRGVYQAGGFPLELPAISLSEPIVKPSTMMYRNFLAMETEELLRSHPIDGAVLMGGCDKTTPGLLMGAISMGIPCVYLPAGPMLRGHAKGEVLGSGSDIWKNWENVRAGVTSMGEWQDVVAGIARSYGHCMTMGTASTMTGIADALGICLPGTSSIPAADAGHIRMSAACGRRVVEMVWEDLRPEKVLTHTAFLNAIAVAMAMGCSTNAIIHVIAMARRAGHDIGLDDFEAASRRVPVIANIRPSGKEYLMEDFFYAGGFKGLMKQLGPTLDLSALTVSGRSWGEELEGTEVWNDDVIRSLDRPIYREGALAVLKGNIAPDGAVVKPSAMDPKFMKHAGPAVVFDSYEEMKAWADDPAADVTPDHVMVFRNAGPVGGPGMPEWGMLPIPRKLLAQGIRDMVRISDCRMSGTSYGCCILHAAPEAFIGGPLALVRTGDMIAIDIDARTIHVDLSPEALEARRAAWTPPAPRYTRGYGWMYAQHIGQADTGCDFDCLETGFGGETPEPAIW